MTSTQLLARMCHDAAQLIATIRERGGAVILTSGNTLLVTGAVASEAWVHRGIWELEPAMLAHLREEAFAHGVVVCSECATLVNLRKPSPELLRELRRRRIMCQDCGHGRATFQRLITESQRQFGRGVFSCS